VARLETLYGSLNSITAREGKERFHLIILDLRRAERVVMGVGTESTSYRGALSDVCVTVGMRGKTVHQKIDRMIRLIMSYSVELSRVVDYLYRRW
jgi:hypothetical protein